MAANVDTKGETATVTDKYAGMAHEAINRVAANAAEAEERIKRAAAEAEERVRRSTRQAREKTDEVTNAVGEYAQQHPLATIGVAFAAGFLLASLLRR